MNRPICVILLLFILTLSYADQAAWITRKQAEAAVKLIREGTDVRHYCEPCGDKTFRTERVWRVEAVKPEGSDPASPYCEVRINNNPVDLAYLYVNMNGKWTNVAVYLRIPVTGVSRILPPAVPEEPVAERQGSSGSEMRDFELERGVEGEEGE